ncbi:MAG: potassium-transporting ATPase subunit KdpA [Desulfobaccales bacterium]
MNASGWTQLILFSVILLVLTKPMGLYLVQVLDANGRTFLDPALKPVERLTYRLAGIDPTKEQDWKGYAVSVLIFSLVTMLLTYFILRLQYFLPLNPQSFGGVAGDLSFETAASFLANASYQNYIGENTMSYLSQMVALASHCFFSTATAIAVAAALVRGLARDKSETLGNFWTDMIRSCLYLLLPISLVFAVFLVCQGTIQNFSAYTTAQVMEPFTTQVAKKDASGQEVKDAQGNTVLENVKVQTQTIPQGPMASQVSIKMLGSNGGGFTNANAAHPFENPTPLSNFIQMLSLILIPSGLTYYLGRQLRNQKHGWSVWAAMFLLFLVGVLICWGAETYGDPRLTALGLDPTTSAMEGKEVRFGIFNSALFTTITTDSSCGAVNAMLDSFTPLGGLVPMFNIHLGEVIFGGAGAGLFGMLVFVVLAIFLAGLMVGRTPDYLGKKIESFDVQVAALSILVPSVFLLGFSALAASSQWGVKPLGNSGPHGFSEILYAFTSCIGNNGSAFAGLSANTLWYNLTLGLATLIGRFLSIVPVLALAGSLAAKKTMAVSPGSFPVSGITFTLLLVGTVIIVGALTFFPAVSLGPIVEHFIMINSNKLF